MEGNLEAYNSMNIDDYTDTYLQKRSEMLYYTIHPESKNTGNGTTYYDNSLNIHTTDKLLITPFTSNEVKFGGDGKDSLVGYKNNDYLFTGDGNDTLYGQKGNDYLEGGAGNDTYIFQSGDGHDTIYDTSGNDTIRLTDVSIEDVRLVDSGDDLKISYGSSSITIQDFDNGINQIENISLEDGKVA